MSPRSPQRFSAVAPPAHLCALVEAAAAGALDRLALATLDAALSEDRITSEETAVLALLADVVAQQVPGHRFAGRMQGIRRRERVSHAASDLLVSRIARMTDGVVLGDLGAARAFYASPGVRTVRASTFCADLPRREAHRIAALVCAESGATVLGTRWPVLVHGGARLTLCRSLSPAFDFPALRSQIDDRPELVMYDSLVRSAQGGPAITWFADAVAGRDRIDWDAVWRVGHIAGWVEPVSLASQVLATRGWSVPVYHGYDSPVQSKYWHTTGTVARRMWLGARLARMRLAPTSARRGPARPRSRRR